MAEKAKKSTKTNTTAKSKTTTVKTKTTTSRNAKADCKSNIGKISCVIIGVVAIVAIIFALVFALNSNTINDAYFVSDNSKLVLTLDNDYDENDVLAPTKSHLVYYYSGDKITGVKYFYEFSSEDKAAEAFKGLTENNEEYDGRPESIKLNGKYVIYTFPANQFEGTSVEDIKSYLEVIENTPEGTIEIDETTEE